MADTRNTEVDDVFRAISRHINCLNEQNKNTRKRAIESVRKELLYRKPELEPSVLQAILCQIFKSVLKVVSDPVEKCRETSVDLIASSVEKIPEPAIVLEHTLPVMVQRLGQADITEPSEEVRLQLCNLLTRFVELCHKAIGPYVDDYVRILQRTIVDIYPEVRKQSCKCASAIAKAVPEHFHMRSESLIKPLVTAISHQHSKVRIEVIYAIGDVIQYGNNKSVSDVVTHLAQRLFDQAPAVRKAVIQVVGNWLLELLDRYSFFHKLIPLLLSGLTDDVPEIQKLAEVLWYDVGLKYERENENDLKDKLDFPDTTPPNYPPGIERANLGCRVLMYHNFSKILPGLIHDLTDWVVSTRIKSAQLLYSLLLYEEDNVTQHLEKVLSGLYQAAGDEEKEVIIYIKKCSKLIGHFVTPEVWCKMLLKQMKLTHSPNALLILSCIIQGSLRTDLKPYLQEICTSLTDPLTYRVADSSLQRQLLNCVQSIVEVCQTDCTDVSFMLFDILISVSALHRTDAIKSECDQLLESLALAVGHDSVHGLYEAHTRQLIASMQEDYSQWTQHSVERLIFDTLLMSCGPVVGEILDDVIPMLVVNLNPDKDPELRLKFFSLLSRLMLNASQTLDSQKRFGDFAITVIKDMVIPNCTWRAGRVAAAIRTTAVSCLWALLQSEVLTKEKLLEILNELVTQLRATLEDDNVSTRLLSCRILTKIFRTVGHCLDQDQLHNMYPDLLKRLDDSSDDIRLAMCQTFKAYFDCFVEGYNVVLYRAHIESLYKGLLVHMDDPDKNIQQAVLEVLMTGSHIAPDMLLKEIDAIKHKHRSTKYCDQLIQHIHSLPKPD